MKKNEELEQTLSSENDKINSESSRQATAEATTEPSRQATAGATTEPSRQATAEATPEPNRQATAEATIETSRQATAEETIEPNRQATAEATTEPSGQATAEAETEPNAQATAGATTETNAEATAEETTEPNRQAKTSDFNTGTHLNNKYKRFIHDTFAGFLIGIAFIIPGFSGGSVAAILGIYERLINAVAELPKKFKKSVVTLFPIFLGLVLGALSLLYPLGYALSAFPLPTVSLFVGLALGGLPSVTKEIDKKFKVQSLLAFLVPLSVAIALSFAPTGADVDLFSLNFGGYLVLFLVGVLGSSALVIPGISGSMILLILGYYNPLIKLVTDYFFKGQEIGTCILVIISCGLGIVIGFYLISLVMKFLLSKYRSLTHIGIVGFIIGSVPTVYISTMKDADLTFETLPESPWHYVACVLLLAIGFAMSFAFAMKSRKKQQ